MTKFLSRHKTCVDKSWDCFTEMYVKDAPTLYRNDIIPDCKFVTVYVTNCLLFKNWIKWTWLIGSVCKFPFDFYFPVSISIVSLSILNARQEFPTAKPKYFRFQQSTLQLWRMNILKLQNDSLRKFVEV